MGDQGTLLYQRMDAAAALARQGRLDEALAACTEISTHSHDDAAASARALLHCGKVLRSLGRLAEAEETFSKIEASNTGGRSVCAEARNLRALTMRIRGSMDEALGVFATVARDFPEARNQCAWAAVYSGGTLRAMGRLSEACDALHAVEGAFGDEPTPCAVALLVRGQTERLRRRLADAHHLLKAVESRFPGETDTCAWARHERARTFELAGFHDDAMAMRLSVLRDFAAQTLRYARALVMAGLYERDADRSLTLYERAAGYDEWQRWSAPARYMTGRIDEAELSRRMFDWHWSADVHFWRAEAALRSGERARAREEYERSLTLNIRGYTWPELEVRSRLRFL